MDDNVLKGTPSKLFFIEMITRDISIEDAIVDLLDNSIDGANRKKVRDFSSIKIDLKVNSSEFVIKDNCGGFSLSVAHDYAFRFGRPEGANPPLDYSVGRFGIGMKRSLFKIGKKFIVESQCEDDHFVVTVDVDEWSKKKKKLKNDNNEDIEIDDWDFDFQVIDDKLPEDGTIIRITDLNKDVKDLFEASSFRKDLTSNIQKMLCLSLQKGLNIYFNDTLLEVDPIEMLISDRVLPYYFDGIVDDVKFRLVAGLGVVGNPQDSGWYIFCNDRLVVAADKTNITGWGVGGVKKWHPDMVMFRGFLYLESKETLSLPLTTTKKGIDATSNVYKKVLPQMVSSMITVISFLRKVVEMGNDANAYRVDLCESLDRISAADLKYIKFDQHPNKYFASPEVNPDLIAQKKENVHIAYDVKKSLADAAKLYSESTSYKELGVKSFDYYVRLQRIADEES
jgi:hypothetical protein